MPCSPLAFEVLPNVRPAGAGDQIEIDLVIRHGNQVAVAEVKRGRGSEGPKKRHRSTVDRWRRDGHLRVRSC